MPQSVTLIAPPDTTQESFTRALGNGERSWRIWISEDKSEVQLLDPTTKWPNNQWYVAIKESDDHEADLREYRSQAGGDPCTHPLRFTKFFWVRFSDFHRARDVLEILARHLEFLLDTGYSIGTITSVELLDQLAKDRDWDWRDY
jgi:hypothetical protein